MKKKVFKYFYNAITSQEKWLNKMSEKGFRLIKTTKLYYEFESCNPNEYRYKIQFVADKTQKELEDYQEFLSSLRFCTFIKPLAFGRYSSHAITLRPYAKGRAKFAMAVSMINKEVIIIEKKNDGKPFEIYTEIKDMINYNKILLNYSLWGIIFILMFEALFFADFEHMRFVVPSDSWSVIVFVAIMLLFMLFVFNFIKQLLKIRILNQKQKTYE